MSLYKQFETDQDLEQKGIIIDYGEFRVTVARAGGSNKRFAKLLEARTKPFKRAIQAETMDPDMAIDILRRVYAEAVILNWETKVKKKFVSGIEAKGGGGLLPFNADNVDLTLKNLPDVFIDLQSQAGKSSLFLTTLREDSAGN